MGWRGQRVEREGETTRRWAMGCRVGMGTDSRGKGSSCSEYFIADIIHNLTVKSV
jgi:hypothetical protein